VGEEGAAVTDLRGEWMGADLSGCGVRGGHGGGGGGMVYIRLLINNSSPACVDNVILIFYSHGNARVGTYYYIMLCLCLLRIVEGVFC
jgi:hypothetical protein